MTGVTHHFLKMNGLGNDFVVLDLRHAPLALDDAVVRRIADREKGVGCDQLTPCLLHTSPSPRDRQKSRMPSSA